MKDKDLVNFVEWVESLEVHMDDEGIWRYDDDNYIYVESTYELLKYYKIEYPAE